MVTLTDIAKLAGVSPSTVSNILNGRTNVGEDTKKRVLKIIKETGYEPNYFASSMRKSSTKIIGIIAEDLTIYTMPIVERVMAVLEDNGYKTLLYNLRMYDKWRDTWYSDETKLFSELSGAMKQFRPLKVDGVVYIGGHCRYLRILSDYDDMNIVVAYAISDDNKIPSVIINDEKGGYDVSKYLLEMGHRKIAVIGGVEENLHTKMRLDGYKKALKEYGIEYEPNLVAYGDWLRHSGYDAAESILKHNPTAVFCMNDYMAAGIYDYCLEKNIKVPDDISVVGYDDVELSEYLLPKLTTCKINSGNIGAEAAQELINRLNNNEAEDINDERIVYIDCKMIFRDSVKVIDK